MLVGMQRYNEDGKPFEPYIIGIAGGSASGKTSVSAKIIETLGVPWVHFLFEDMIATSFLMVDLQVVLLSLDSFYKVLTPEQSAAAHRK
jgi:uridine kinase